MAQTVTISQRAIEQIFARLDALTKEVQTIKAKLFEEEPPYGSEKWWEWAHKKGLEDIKAGKYTKVHDEKELTAYLNSLKAS